MKYISVILVILICNCNADVSRSRNYKLPLSSSTTIPSPVQSLVPPSFENPIKDYTVGLLPPLFESQVSSANPAVSHQHHYAHVPSLAPAPAPVPVHRHSTRLPAGLITSTEPLRTPVQYRNRYAVHHNTHQSVNLVQPQVYQPKTVVYQQPNSHHLPHTSNYQQLYQRTNNHGAGFVLSPATQSHNHYSVSLPQHYGSVTQSGIRQYAVPARYASTRVPVIVQHAHPSDHQSAKAARTIPSSGARIIQTYPSVSYQVPLQQHGSALNPVSTNSRLDPELVHIINEVLGQYHP